MGPPIESGSLPLPPADAPADAAASAAAGGDITGAAAAKPSDVAPEVARIKASTDLPIIVGFGIRTPDAARDIAAVADGTVVGSAIVKLIEEKQPVADILAYVKSLADGAHSA